MNTFQYTESVTISPFTFLGGTIENLVNKFLVTGAGNMMDWLSPIVLVGVALYFMMKGYEQLFGDSRELAPDVVKRCLIILCITALALNVDNYTDYVMEFINALGAELSAAVYSGEQTPVSVYQSLDSMLIKGIGQVSQALSRVGLTSPSTWDWIITAVVILVGMCGLTITAALIVIGTEFMLKILLVVGPLFLVAVCFPATRPHFDNWTKKIIEMVFIKMFALAVITLGLNAIDDFMGVNNIETIIKDGGNPLGVAVQLLVLYGVLGYVLRQVPSLAAALAGSFPTSQSFTAKDALTPTLVAAGMMGKMMGKMSVGQGGENTLQRSSRTSPPSSPKKANEDQRHNDLMQRMREAEYLNKQQNND